MSPPEGTPSWLIASFYYIADLYEIAAAAGRPISAAVGSAMRNGVLGKDGVDLADGLS